MNKWTILGGSLHCPHIYIILSKDVIYIGETQKLPFSRWHSHIGKSGSFSKNLDKFLGGTSCYSYMKSLSFCSFPCANELKGIQSDYCGFRIPTQALEHKLHELMILEKPFGSDKKIISETTKTAPRHFYHWPEIDIIAKDLLASLKKELAL
ncbi:hypothetical protein D5R81_00035 [Parashewanella spongiae]|uniref:GIY-YIG domain-containing protein n=1 Tax=Parashewanella spongiae TaxID=342950 RepID=A0A3A6UNX1_9GAMM|nr:hypothetical protein [Parashewanella spongiae]MCL1076572.1 hypothetical protein [Parashewanella spongiae]RJY19531.1 hypothetical protein D5R81_00035 [Parashewanella spongiae]